LFVVYLRKLVAVQQANNADFAVFLIPINAKRENSKTQACISTFMCKFFYIELSADALAEAKQKLKNRKTPLYTEWSERFGTIHWPRVFSLYRNHVDRKAVDLIFRSLHSSITTRISIYAHLPIYL